MIVLYFIRRNLAGHFVGESIAVVRWQIPILLNTLDDVWCNEYSVACVPGLLGQDIVID